MWQTIFTSLLVVAALLIAGGTGYLGYRLVRDDR
jgi:hypothetical protein